MNDNQERQLLNEPTYRKKHYTKNQKGKWSLKQPLGKERLFSKLYSILFALGELRGRGEGRAQYSVLPISPVRSSITVLKYKYQ